MGQKPKVETVLKRQEQRLQDARIIFSAMMLMDLNKGWSEQMSDRVQKFLKSFE